MTYSDRFLSALGAWQRGWREDRDRRIVVGRELVAAVDAENLPDRFRTVNTVCYRKRFLVPNNPQNGGDLGPLFLNGFIEEGLTSWTTNKKFSQDFKDPLREGTFSAVFARLPRPGEVLVNIPELWANEEFEDAVEDFHSRGAPNADALHNFRFRQGEIVMDAKLEYDELFGFCGRSSPFDVLCELAGLQTEDEYDAFWKKLVESDGFPEEPFWLSQQGTKATLDRTRNEFLRRHGDKIDSINKSTE